FYHAYDNYMRYAFPHDELKPMTKSFTDSLSELGNLKVLENLPQVYNGSALTLDESLSRFYQHLICHYQLFDAGNKKKIIVCKLKLNLKAAKDQASKRKVDPKPNPKTPVKPKSKEAASSRL
ncbi:alpha-mannosidase I MNS5, partial [Tanacetum coccineum]